MSTNTENSIPAPEEVGKLLTKIALADQGFLVLLLMAATKATDALTNREVDNSGTQKGAADAVRVEAAKNEASASASASSSLGIKTPYIIGGAALLLGGVMMMKKK